MANTNNFFVLLRAFTFLCCIATVIARSEMTVIFKNTEGFKSLNENQQQCGITTVSSVCWMSTCKDKDCFRADPQFMSDTADECLVALGSMDGMYSVDTYNGIMAFFGNECGTFQVQFKVRPTSCDVTALQGWAHESLNTGTAGNRGRLQGLIFHQYRRP